MTGLVIIPFFADHKYLLRMANSLKRPCVCNYV